MAHNFKNRIKLIEETEGFIPGETERVTVKSLWAEIKTMRGSDFTQWKIAGNKATSRFIVRYTKGIEPHMIVHYKGYDYEIESIVNDNEENKTITIIAEAIL